MARPQNQKRTPEEIFAEIQGRAGDIRERRSLTREQAIARVLEQEPALYAEYSAAHKMRATRTACGLE